jgi:hypothetical protein
MYCRDYLRHTASHTKTVLHFKEFTKILGSEVEKNFLRELY